MGNPQTGNLWVAYVDKTATPVTDRTLADYQLIGGQQGANYDRSLGIADVTDKDSSNWTEAIPTNRDGELTLDNLLEADDDGLDVLEAMHIDRETRFIKLTNGTVTYEFQAICTAFPLDLPQDDAAKVSITLKRTGAEYRTPAL